MWSGTAEAWRYGDGPASILIAQAPFPLQSRRSVAPPRARREPDATNPTRGGRCLRMPPPWFQLRDDWGTPPDASVACQRAMVFRFRQKPDRGPMAAVVFFRAGDGTLSVTPAADADAELAAEIEPSPLTAVMPSAQQKCVPEMSRMPPGRPNWSIPMPVATQTRPATVPAPRPPLARAPSMKARETAMIFVEGRGGIAAYNAFCFQTARPCARTRNPATAAASVGMKTPLAMPAIGMTGVSIGRIAPSPVTTARRRAMGDGSRAVWNRRGRRP